VDRDISSSLSSFFLSLLLRRERKKEREGRLQIVKHRSLLAVKRQGGVRETPSPNRTHRSSLNPQPESFTILYHNLSVREIIIPD